MAKFEVRRDRDDGRVLSAAMMGDGVLLGVFFDGHNEGVIGLDVSEALELAQAILAAYCRNCHQRGEINDAGECADCAWLREMREDDDRYACKICGQPGGH
jgi:hypothetical protein